MKLTDIITINKGGLEEVTETVQGHLLNFANECLQGLNDDFDFNGEISSEFASAIKLSLSILDNENEVIDKDAWATMVYTLEEREWAIQEEEKGDK